MIIILISFSLSSRLAERNFIRIPYFSASIKLDRGSLYSMQENLLRLAKSRDAAKGLARFSDVSAEIRETRELSRGQDEKWSSKRSHFSVSFDRSSKKRRKWFFIENRVQQNRCTTQNFDNIKIRDIPFVALRLSRVLWISTPSLSLSLFSIQRPEKISVLSTEQRYTARYLDLPVLPCAGRQRVSWFFFVPRRAALISS